MQNLADTLQGRDNLWLSLTLHPGVRVISLCIQVALTFPITPDLPTRAMVRVPLLLQFFDLLQVVGFVLFPFLPTSFIAGKAPIVFNCSSREPFVILTAAVLARQRRDNKRMDRPSSFLTCTRASVVTLTFTVLHSSSKAVIRQPLYHSANLAKSSDGLNQSSLTM